MEETVMTQEFEQVEPEVDEASVAEEELPLCEESSGWKTIVGGAMLCAAAGYGIYSAGKKVVQSETVQKVVGKVRTKHEARKSARLAKKEKKNAEAPAEEATAASDSENSKRSGKNATK